MAFRWRTSLSLPSPMFAADDVRKYAMASIRFPRDDIGLAPFRTDFLRIQYIGRLINRSERRLSPEEMVPSDRKSYEKRPPTQLQKSPLGPALLFDFAVRRGAAGAKLAPHVADPPDLALRGAFTGGVS